MAPTFGDPGWQSKQSGQRPNTNGWDNWWAGVGGMLNDAGNNMGNGFNDWLSGKQGRDKLNAFHNSDSYKANVAQQDRDSGGRGPLAEPSQSLRLIQSLGQLPGINTNGGPGRQGHDDIPESTYRDGPSEDELRMKELQSLLGQDFKASGEYNSMIEQAYAGALANIGKAKGDANANFQQSDKAIEGLTAGHVAEIKGADRNAVNQVGNDLQKSYSNIYDESRQQLVDSKNADVSETGNMLHRLGIQEAGTAGAGDAQREAITRLTQDEAGAKQQASTYQAADLTRNTEQAQSQASAGVERRSALHNQLQKILGTIGDSEATVNNSMAMAKLQGAQNEKSDFRQQQQFNLDSLRQLEDRNQNKADSDRNYALELQKLAAKNSGSGSGGVFQAVGNDVSSRGIDPQPYLDSYSKVAQSTFNPQVDGDKTMFLVRKMKEQNPQLNDNEILRYVMGINNYGTDKLTG